MSSWVYGRYIFIIICFAFYNILVEIYSYKHQIIQNTYFISYSKLYDYEIAYHTQR